MKKRVLSFVLACLMVVSTFIVVTPHIYVDAVEYIEGLNQWTLPMDWTEDLDKDSNGWELASKMNGLWRLTSFEDLTDGSTVRWAASTSPLASGVDNGESPTSYIESRSNRSVLTTLASGWNNWYVNFGHRYQNKAFGKGADLTSMYVYPGNSNNGTKFNNATVVFTAPADNTYDFTESVKLILSGAVVEATVRKNGEVLTTATPTASGTTLSGTVELKKDDVLMFAFTLTSETTVKDANPVLDLTNLVVKVHDDTASGGNTVAIGTKYDVPSDFYTGLTSEGTKINGNWQLATYDTKTQQTYYNFKAPSSSHSTAKWYFDNTEEPYAGGGKGTFRYTANSGEYVLGTNPGSNSHPEIASAVIFTAPDDGIYKFDVNTLSRGLNGGSTGSRAVIFFVMKDNVIYDITHPKYNVDTVEAMTGEIALKKGEKLYFCAQRYTYYTEHSNDYGTDWLGARYKALSVEKVAELTAGDEVVTKYTFAPDGTSLINGQFEMKAYDYTTKTLKDLTLTTGTNWQAINEESGNWIFQYGRETGSIAGWGPDGSTTADEGAALVFTAPEDGTYNITGHFLKRYVKSTAGKCHCDYRIILEDGTVVFDGTNYDECTASAYSNLTHTLGASVKLDKDEKVYIVKSPNAEAVSGSQRGEIYSMTVAKIAERAGEFVSESWELPMDWSSGLEVDDNGWDLAVKGPWKLVAFKDANDVSTIYEQASADKAANGSNIDGIGPGPWIESANNRANTVKDTTTWSGWYINPGKRWQNNVVFAKGNNSSYMKVRPMRDENNKYPTVVFTAPEDGLYSYNEFVTGTCFADENGATVVGTATVRVNGLVVDSFSPSSSNASKTLKGNVALKKGDLLMFTFALNTPSRFTGEIDGTGVQVFDLGKTVVTRIAPLPADYEIVDHTPVFKGDSATSTSGNAVLKGYDVDADTLYDVIMKPHPDPSVTDKWIAVDPKATNSWDNGATSWSEVEYYAHLWTGTNDGAITGVGGSHQYKSGAALVFTVPNDGTYAFNARLGYGNMTAQPSYSDFVITVNGETVFTNSNYSQTSYPSNSAIGMDMFWIGELKAGDVVVIMKRPNDNTSVINTSDDSSAFVKISEIKNLPAYVEPEGEKDPTPSGEYKDWTLPVDWSETDAHNADGYELPVKGNWELLSYNAVGTDPLATFSGTPIGVNNTATSTGKPQPFLAGKKYSSGFGVADWYLNHNEMWSEVGGAFKTAKLDNTYYVTPNVHNGPIAIAFTAPEDNVYTFNEALVVKNFKSSKGDTLSIGAVVYKQATDGTLTALRSFVSSTTEESSATLTRSVELKTGEKLIFGFYNPLTTTPDFVNNATTEKDYYGCFITDLTVSVGVKDPSQGGGTEPGGPSQPGIIPPDTDAAVGDKWNLPTDFYTGMTSAGEKKNGNWQLAAYDTKTLRTYYKFNAPEATHTADNWYIQHSEPYEGQRGSFAYSTRGFETNPGNDNHTEMASVILFTAPADGLYKYDVDTFSYGLNKKSTGSRAVIFYVMKDGVIYDITHPTYNATNTENLAGYIPLKKGEQIYFCAQRYTKYTVAESPNGDWPAWIGARYDALSVEKVAELTAGDEVVTNYTFAPDGTSLVNGQFEMKAYDFINKTVNDATLNSGANWTVTAVSGNTLFWKSATAGSVVGWGPDGTTTNANEGAAIVFTAPEDGKYNITGHFEKTYVKSANGKHYCDYKIIRENGKVIFDGSNYDESTDDSFNYLNHTFGETITLKKGQKIYIVKSPNASATVGAQGADLYALTVTKIATIVPPAGPDERPPYVVTPTPNGSSFDLPMDWSVTGTYDANGWELAQKGPWRLTSFDNPGKISSIRLNPSTGTIQKDSNTKSPYSYLETAKNRENVGGGAGYTTWYMNFTTRWTGAGISYGDNVSYMKITPMNVSKKNNPAIVFIAPDDGSYSYSHLVTQMLFDKDGAPVNVTVTVRVNGELVETFNPTVDNPSKTLHGLTRLKAGDVLAFVYSQTTSVTLADHVEFIRVEDTNVTKVGDYVYTEGHHCYGGTATCMSPAICESCGEEYGMTDVNNHVAGCVPTYDSTATTHTEFWSKCQTRFASENHTWVEGKCYVCDYACLHEHDRYAATCISGAICEECYMAHGAKDPNHHVDGLEFAFEYATTKVHYTRWACCMNKFVEAEHTFENGICTVCEIKKGEQGDLAGMLPGTGTDYDFIPNPAAGKGSWNPQTGTISIIAVISTAVVSTVTGKAASKKRRRRI